MRPCGGEGARAGHRLCSGHIHDSPAPRESEPVGTAACWRHTPASTDFGNSCCFSCTKNSNTACAEQRWHPTAPFKGGIFPLPAPAMPSSLCLGDDKERFYITHRGSSVSPCSNRMLALSYGDVKQVLKTQMFPVLVSQKVDKSIDGFSHLVKPELPVLIGCF